MKAAATLFALLGFAQGSLATPALDRADTPLLTYAMQQQFAAIPDTEETLAALSRATHALSVIGTPREHCARALGAPRFADLWRALGDAHANRGEHPAAIRAFRRALDCRPRDIDLLSSLATELKWAGELGEARTLLERAASIETDNAAIRQQMGQIDFIAGRWADAIGHYRFAATRQRASHDATYAEIMFHLAQRRAGVAQPEVLARPKPPPQDEAPEDAGIAWPLALLETLRGARTEAALLAEAQVDSGYPSPQERLCEALYYVGQERLARGDTAMARQYFAAVVNTRVLYFIEHNLALIELRRISAPRPAATRVD